MKKRVTFLIADDDEDSDFQKQEIEFLPVVYGVKNYILFALAGGQISFIVVSLILIYIKRKHMKYRQHIDHYLARRRKAIEYIRPKTVTVRPKLILDS